MCDPRAVVLAVGLLGMTGCSGDCPPPPRPAEVPRAAVWAGGCDGGSWVACEHAGTDGPRYRCSIYGEASGDVVAAGEYVRRPGPLPKSMTDIVTFSFYDGRTIGMTDGDVLVPDGWIEFPGAGKRRLFRLGEPVSDEVPAEPGEE